jgi:hypothetical protein
MHRWQVIESLRGGAPTEIHQSRSCRSRSFGHLMGVSLDHGSGPPMMPSTRPEPARAPCGSVVAVERGRRQHDRQTVAARDLGCASTRSCHDLVTRQVRHRRTHCDVQGRSSQVSPHRCDDRQPIGTHCTDCKSVGVCLQWFESTTCHAGQTVIPSAATTFRLAISRAPV